METTQELRKRSEIPKEDQWNVESLYPSVEEWEVEFKKASDEKSGFLCLDKVLSKQGKISEMTPKEMQEFIDAYLLGQRRLEKLYVYASLRHDEDMTNDDNKANSKKVTSLYHEYNEKTSWVEPEILSLSNEKIEEFINSSELAPYKFYLEKMVRRKPHTLSPEMEKLLSQAGEVLETPSKVFTAISDTDFEFPKVKDSQGKLHTLTHGTWGSLIRSKDRELRKNAFIAYHNKYKEYENTFAETLNGVVQNHYFIAKARNFKNCLQAALFGKNVDESVYRNLIKAVHDNIGALHRYVSLRKKILGVDELHLYDLYVPLTKAEGGKRSYKEAEELTIASVAPLGKEYQEQLRKGLEELRWVDRYENKGKRSGAYSGGCFDSQPYILMNYVGELNDVFTLAHEAGHSMHTLLSNQNQPYHYSQYSIFVAEVASTFNEDNLRDYLMKHSKSVDEKIYLLNEAIEDIRTTLFRQVMFAEFELKIHEFVEKKIPLTPKLLKETYHDLNKFYFGDDIVIDEEIDMEWARVPHFYYNFYVFQYATGISAAIYLANRVRNGGEKERNDYLNFLKAGSSKYPIDVLKMAGVDMTTPEPITKAIDVFKQYLNDFEKLLEETQKKDEL